MSRYFNAKIEEYLEEFEQNENYNRRKIEDLKEEIKQIENKITDLEDQQHKTRYVIKMLFELKEIEENS
jgi:polyhydroxyalkanoate synthesis regulator phasin